MVQKRDTRITVDLLEHKQAWLDYCEANGITPSAAFRQIVQSLLAKHDQSQAMTIADNDPEKATVRKKISLTPSEAERVEAVAKVEGFSSTRWIVALIRARLTGTPQLGQQELEALAKSNLQLLQIGRNLNQVARALNTSPEAQRTFSVDAIEKLDGFIRRHTKAVSEAMSANAYRWRIK